MAQQSSLSDPAQELYKSRKSKTSYEPCSVLSLFGLIIAFLFGMFGLFILPISFILAIIGFVRVKKISNTKDCG